MSASTQQKQCPCQADAADGEASLTRLVHEHRAHLARVARREGLSAEDAFDAVQEAFSTFLLLPPSHPGHTTGGARPLLVAITRNIARNARRLHVVARPHLTDAAVVEHLPDDSPPADQRLALAEETGRLARCVGRLADIQRSVITLRMLDELPGNDVARVLGIKEGHLAVLLHRAKASLLNCMKQGDTPS